MVKKETHLEQSTYSDKQQSMYRKFIILVICMIAVITSNAQDPLFTQFYYTPVYVNPGLAGTGKNNLRLSGLTKMQWFNLYKPYKYINASVDLSVYDDYLRNVMNLGLLVNHTNKGFFKNTNISGIVGRSFGTGNVDCSDWFLSLAVQGGVNLGSVNTKELLFVDQLDQNGITGDASQIDLNFNNNSKNYFDFSSGFVFTWRDFMIGGAAHHINKPSISFSGESANSRLPMKVTGHISWMYDNGTVTFKPTLMMQTQNQSSALVIGSLVDFNEFPLQLSAWYRNNTSMSYNNAYCVGLTWKWGEGKTVSTNRNEYANRMGISYDAEVNKPGIGTTHGSLEFGVQRDIIIGDNSKCPTASSGICTYRFPWEFF